MVKCISALGGWLQKSFHFSKSRELFKKTLFLPFISQVGKCLVRSSLDRENFYENMKSAYIHGQLNIFSIDLLA